MEFFKILCPIFFLIAQIFVSILVLGLGLGLPNPILEKGLGFFLINGHDLWAWSILGH